MTNRTVVYIDRVCKGNPGPGGWAWVVLGERSDSGDVSIKQKNLGGALDTTYSRMEMTAVAEAIYALDGPLLIMTDNDFFSRCFEGNWRDIWESNGWITQKDTPVKHQDLWHVIFKAHSEGKVVFGWVDADADAGHPGMEAANKLAREITRTIADSNPAVVYTAGAGESSFGPSGWAWVVPGGQSDSGSVPGADHHHMSLLAVLEAINTLDSELLIMTDSGHIFHYFEEQSWGGRVRNNNWLTARKKLAPHPELWKPIIRAYKNGRIDFAWVKEDSDDPGYEAVVKLAQQAAGAIAASGQRQAPARSSGS